MRVVPVLVSLLAVGRKPVKWFIDGNNLMGHKGTPKERDQVIQKLKPMAATGGLDTVIVFDSHLPGDGDETRVIQNGQLSTVITGEGITADDYILGEIDSIKESGSAFVQVVTADRDLRRKALGTRTVVRGVINPVVFWRRYRPRLTGMKKPDNTKKEK